MFEIVPTVQVYVFFDAITLEWEVFSYYEHAFIAAFDSEADALAFCAANNFVVVAE